MILVKQINEIQVGDTATFAKTFSQGDIATYVAVTNDFSPIHINAGYAAGTRFGRTIVPGILLGGLLTSTMATDLVGCLPVSTLDTFQFKAPVFVGDTIEARLTIESVDVAKRSLVLAGVCINQDGRQVLICHAEMRFPRSS